MADNENGQKMRLRWITRLCLLSIVAAAHVEIVNVPSREGAHSS